MKRIRQFTVVAILSLLPSLLYAQREVKTAAEYTYHARENETLEMAKRTALERAQTEAIANEFGTVVEQETNISGNTDKLDIFVNGGSRVRGEWIETLGEPNYDVNYEQGMLVVTVRVSGRIRERTSASIPLEVKVLRNGTKDRFEDREFHDGDELFLSFRSPKKGCLAVYLVVAETATAYCMLPYSTQQEGIYPIEANQSYLFFSIDKAPVEERPFVDEYVMNCINGRENNLIYVIFSPNDFSKAIDNGEDEMFPRQLPEKEFLKWLGKCRMEDKSMQVERRWITLEE